MHIGTRLGRPDLVLGVDYLRLLHGYDTHRDLLFGHA